MKVRKNIPLEEKLHLPIKELPLSKNVRNELYSKGVCNLGQIVSKFHKHPGRIMLPGFTDKVFSEAAYLLVTMGLDYGRKAKGEYNIIDTLGSKLDRWVSNKLRAIIDYYANEEI